ncbi:MAG: MBL fold metallo-hydrolase, partial [Chloroflexota bacterium]
MTDTQAKVERFENNSGVVLYRIPMEVFPNFIGYSYLMLGAGVPTLIDTGSGFGDSTANLLEGLRTVKSDFGEKIAVTDIERIIISHGHIDHFGGLTAMIEATGGATVGVHPLDRRVLTNYNERRTVATKDVTIFLERAGLSQERVNKMLDMY